MYFSDPRLQYEVRVERPNPLFAKMLQQAIGGQEGEMRVCLQYFFQGWAQPAAHARYRDMLLQTATEEIGHIEMLATAVAMNLDGAPLAMQEEAASKNGAVAAILGGMDARQLLSAGLHAMPTDANGVPFTGGYVVASGNLAADMYANVMAESTGRVLAARLYEMTDDPGMKDMLAYLIARDAMHQNQWLAVLEDMGAEMPIPATFPREQEAQAFSYAYMVTAADGHAPEGRWTEGTSIDGQGTFSVTLQPGAKEPKLPPPDPRTHNDVKLAPKVR